MRKHFFSDFPWGFSQNVVIFFALILVGIFLEGLFQGNGVLISSFPYNVLGLGLQLLIVFFIGIYSRAQKIRAWLTSTPMILISNSFLLFFIVLMGFIPQPDQEALNFYKVFGLTHLMRSWYFVLIFLLSTASLQLVILGRCRFKKLKDFAFFFNHLGVLIVLLASFWGSSDLKKVKLDLFPNELVWNGYDQKDRYIDLPFALKLNHFQMDEYNPEFVFLDNETKKILKERKNHYVEEKKKFSFQDWEVDVLKYEPYVWWMEGKLVLTKQWGSASGVLVKVTNIKDRSQIEDWVSTESFAVERKSLTLPTSLPSGKMKSLLLIDGKPKRYSSEIEWFSPDGKKGKTRLEVNHPFSFNGWKIYQYGYDDRLGRWSQMSVVEAVRDPWLPYVFLGLLTALLGVFLWLWSRKDYET